MTGPFACARMASPVGPLRLVASERGLLAVLWAHQPLPPPPPTANDHPARPDADGPFAEPGHAVRCQPTEILDRACHRLERYFAGDPRAFDDDSDARDDGDDLPLHLVGTTFQRQAWSALASIPYGHTRSYGEQAAQLGRPAAARAVGAANGRNPLPIVLPCHRLVGHDGSLTGFAGGLEAKRHLLDLEQQARSN